NRSSADRTLATNNRALERPHASQPPDTDVGMLEIPLRPRELEPTPIDEQSAGHVAGQRLVDRGGSGATHGSGTQCAARVDDMRAGSFSEEMSYVLYFAPGACS